MSSLRYAVLDHIPDFIVVLDHRDYVVFLNQQASVYRSQIQSVFVEGAYFPDMVTSSQRELVIALLEEIKKTRKDRSVESDYKDPKGANHSFEILFHPVAGDDNKYDSTYVIIKEITRERIFQKKNSQLTVDFSALLQHANAVIFTIDSQEYITDWNAECSRITGYLQSEVMATRISEYIAAQSAETFVSFLQKIFSGKTAESLELHFKSRSQREIILLLNATPKTNAAGKLIGAVFIGHDVTELYHYRRSLENSVNERTMKLEEALRKEKALVEIKNRFVSMASHEFRIPLSNIFSSASFIDQHASVNEIARDKINNIKKQVEHMKVLIEDVLTIGRSEVVQLKPSHERFDLAEFLADISSEVRINASNSHTIDLTLSAPVISVESDPKLLRNVFLNLLSNAIKFSPGSNQVLVEVQQGEKEVQIVVTDYGIGIPDEELTDVFESFKRGSNTGNIKGTGLGLSIVKRALDTLRGSVHVTSTVNKGTTFTIQLPNKSAL